MLPTQTKETPNISFGLKKIILKNNKFQQQKLDYIHQNPVRAGIVDEPWDYIYSSARAYASMKCIIEIDHIEQHCGYNRSKAEQYS